MTSKEGFDAVAYRRARADLELESSGGLSDGCDALGLTIESFLKALGVENRGRRELIEVHSCAEDALVSPRFRARRSRKENTRDSNGPTRSRVKLQNDVEKASLGNALGACSVAGEERDRRAPATRAELDGSRVHEEISEAL